MEKLIWTFEENDGFAFVVPSDKKQYDWDFYVSSRDFFWAKDWDLVEIEILDWKRWKSKQAKVIKVLNEEDKKEKIWKTIIWIYSSVKNEDYGFVDTEDWLKWYFVHNKNKNTALSWDKVEALVKTFKWRQEAEILKIIERKKTLIVWEYKQAKWNFWFVIPKSDLKTDIFVASTNAFWAHSWDIVWVEITKWNKKSPEWVIKEIIASKWNLDPREEDIRTIAVEMWAKITFPMEVQKELENMSENIDETEFKKRKDLRKLFTFTIDWADAKDLDDAISIEKLENGDYKLYVHIADVSNYIKENWALDREALERWTSIYLADRVIPMLPEKLSNNLCSLNPYTNKLTLTCEMLVSSKTGQTIKSEVYESIISSDFRMTYKEIDEITEKRINVWDELIFRWIANLDLLDAIKNSNNLKDLILSHREKSGVLNFDFPETVIDFDESWEPSWVKEYPKYNSNKLIEVFMVSANEAVAKQFSKYPFLYRIHEKPKDFDIKDLEYKLKLFQVKFKFKTWSTSEFAELLEKFEDLDETRKRFLQQITLRTLTQAMYSHINFWHFWLGLEFYSHFTSPIRRYPDLQIHRIIKEFLNHKLDSKRQEHYKSILPKIAIRTSDRERLSEKLEYKVRDYFLVKYYKNKIWEEFDAVISGLISKWFFVTLPDSAEWFVELQKSNFDEKAQSHFSSWKKYTLWDSIKVKLIEADEELLRLNFEIVASI